MKASCKSLVALAISVLLVFSGLFSASVSAGMVSSHSAVTEQTLAYDRSSLLQALNANGVREQLVAMGVDTQQVEQRIAVMTPDELAQLNAEIKKMPAGQGAVGILLTLFIVFVVTDMLCATNIFSFVRCIN